MDLIGDWKLKVDESVSLFKRMSKSTKLDAISYWNASSEDLARCLDDSSILPGQQHQLQRTEDQNHYRILSYLHESEENVESPPKHNGSIHSSRTNKLDDNSRECVPGSTTQDMMANFNDYATNSHLKDYHETRANTDDPMFSPMLYDKPTQNQQVETDNRISSVFCLSSTHSNQQYVIGSQEYMSLVPEISPTTEISSTFSPDTTKIHPDFLLNPDCYSSSDIDSLVSGGYSSRENFVRNKANFDTTERIHSNFDASRFYVNDPFTETLGIVEPCVGVKVSSTLCQAPTLANEILGSMMNEYDQSRQVHNLPQAPPMGLKNSEAMISGHVDHQNEHSEVSVLKSQISIGYTQSRLPSRPQVSEFGESYRTTDPVHTTRLQNQLHTCEICGKTGFSSKGNLKRHRDTHSGKKPFKCDICNSSYTEKKSLQIHLRTHSGDKPYKCDICDKVFNQAVVLKGHMTTHMRERKFSCTKCDKSFKQKGELRMHTLRHEGVKKLGCPSCQARFLTRGELDRHIRTHTGEKPFGCDLCGKRFKRKQSLDDHMNRHIRKTSYK